MPQLIPVIPGTLFPCFLVSFAIHCILPGRVPPCASERTGVSTADRGHVAADRCDCGTFHHWDDPRQTRRCKTVTHLVGFWLVRTYADNGRPRPLFFFSMSQVFFWVSAVVKSFEKV